MKSGFSLVRLRPIRPPKPRFRLAKHTSERPTKEEKLQWRIPYAKRDQSGETRGQGSCHPTTKNRGARERGPRRESRSGFSCEEMRWDRQRGLQGAVVAGKQNWHERDGCAIALLSPHFLLWKDQSRCARQRLCVRGSLERGGGRCEWRDLDLPGCQGRCWLCPTPSPNRSS